MPVVIVEMLDASSIEEKRQLVKDMTAALVKMGVAAEEVQVILRENPRSCWGTAGKLCSDFRIPEGA